MKFYGKITFPSQTFDFTDFDGTNENILFTCLADCVDINDKSVEEIHITFNNPTPNNIKVVIYYTDGTTNTRDTTIGLINADLDILLFGGDITGYGCLSTNSIYDNENNLLRNCVDDTVNYAIFYRLSSSKNTVTKNLTWVSTVPIKFNRPIRIRDFQLDVEMNISDERFNYIYIIPLHRFYYVTDMELTNDFARLTLHIDVLSSWEDLIRSQYAFIERNENDYDADKVDEYVTYDFNKEKIYSVITPTNDFLAFNVVPSNRLNFVLITVYGV